MAEIQGRRNCACSIDGCTRPVRARTWCTTHYERWRQHGDPHHNERPNHGQGWSVDNDGYVRVWRPDHPLASASGEVLEHRLVMFEAGFDIAGMDVHHKNDDKADNRIENLEVMTHGEHWRRHREERGVTNAYGTFPLRRLRNAT